MGEVIAILALIANIRRAAIVIGAVRQIVERIIEHYRPTPPPVNIQLRVKRVWKIEAQLQQAIAYADTHYLHHPKYDQLIHGLRLKAGELQVQALKDDTFAL